MVYYVDQHPKSVKMMFIDGDVDKDGVDDVDEDVVEEVVVVVVHSGAS